MSEGKREKMPQGKNCPKKNLKINSGFYIGFYDDQIPHSTLHNKVHCHVTTINGPRNGKKLQSDL